MNFLALRRETCAVPGACTILAIGREASISLATGVSGRTVFPAGRHAATETKFLAKILAISSFVASGHVGLRAIVPALQALGHETIAIPSVVLSNHYGYPNVGVSPVTPKDLQEMFWALESNGALRGVEAVLTGYFPSLAHVSAAERLIEELKAKNPALIYLCDPVLGDDPGGLYVAGDAAKAIQSGLVPLADILTPNRFELSWLTGDSVESVEGAHQAMPRLGCPYVAATSIPGIDGLIANVYCGKGRPGQVLARRHENVPHGTGDLFAALLLGQLLASREFETACKAAVAGVELVIEASLGRAELNLVETIGQAVGTDK